MPTKSKDNTTDIVLEPYVDTYTWFGAKYDGSVWGAQSLPASVALLGSKEDITYDGGRKTTQLVIGDEILEYPVFKTCNHEKAFRGFRATGGGGSFGSTYCCGTTINYERIFPGNPHLTWFNFFDIPNNVADIGIGIRPETIANSYSHAPSIIKAKCLDDSKLLGFPDAFNVLNFILELRDVKRLPELISKWKMNSHDLSDKYLGTSFGVIPFASDIMSIFERVFNSGQAASKWDNMALKNKVLNAHINIPPSDLITSSPYFVSYEKGVAKLEARNINKHHAYLDFGLIPLPGHSEFEVDIRQEIKSIGHVYFIPRSIDNLSEIKRHLWGVDRPISAVWNALPWSFVVDWIVNIGDLIDEFERGEPLLKMRIVSAGYSVKVTTYVEIRSLMNGFPTGVNYGKHIGYYRRPIGPREILTAGRYYPLKFTLPEGEQTLLGSALLHQLLK